MLPINQTFAHTLIKSRRWVDELAEDLGLADPDRAIRALRAGLHGVRDFLPDGAVVALGAQLPMLIRGLYYDGWRQGKHHHGRDRDAIHAVLRSQLGNETISATRILEAVIHLLARHVSRGEMEHIVFVLPRQIAALWAAAINGANVVHP